jgi:sugar phosphate isomerase/epimerase
MAVTMSNSMTRRDLLTLGGLAGASALLGRRADAQPARMKVTLNSSTIRPAKLEDKVRIAAEAGYDGIELWDNELDEHQEAGGSLEDLAKRITDLGLFVPNIIGLWDSMPQDPDAWSASLEASKRRMDRAVRVGSLRIAAIPAPDRPDIDVLWAADRYRELIEAGESIGITVAVEFVGFLQGIHTLGQAVAIALESHHPKACIVGDTFHLYRGGSMFGGIKRLQGSLLAVFHFNDAPADPPQFQQGDEHRIYPGDGILPLVELVRDLREIGFPGPLSLELFNRALWEKDALEVARVGREKIAAIMDEAGIGGAA